MAAGLPFVASDLPTTAVYCAGRGVAVLAAAGDPAAYATEIAALLDDPSRRREMSARGPALVRGEYSWEREAERLKALYRELLDEHLPKSDDVPLTVR
jgi:phosphatidylinositol alpha-mannosyltransferase